MLCTSECRSREKKERGRKKGKTSEFGEFLSLWWIDQETKGPQKEKCKNRIAPLPWHLFSLPIYPITSLLALPFARPASFHLWHSLSFPLPLLVLLFSVFPPNHPCPPLLRVRSLIHSHLHPSKDKKPLRPNGFPLHHITAVKALNILLCLSQMRPFNTINSGLL